MRDCRPCQDDVAVVMRGEVVALAIADGHGSSVHAETGARIAVQVATESLLAFAEHLVATGVVDLRIIHGFAHDPFRVQLVREWVRRVQRHAGGEHVTLKDYGSTLLFAVIAPAFLLLGQLGDGDLLLINGARQVSRPLPLDPACFAEETPSLCLPEAWTDLRVLAMPRPDGEAMVLLSTDGYSKSYATDSTFESIGPDYLDMVRDIGVSGVGAHLEEFLTAVTTGGSGDDIALGLIYLAPANHAAPDAPVPAGATGAAP